MGFQDWSIVASENATKPGINWAEGMPPRDIDDSARQMMADMAYLKQPGGAALLGADDASAGSKWTSLQGFINYIKSAAGASTVKTTSGVSVQSAIDSLSDNTTNPARIRQLLHSNLYLVNNFGGGVNILGDSISHGAYAGNAYTNHWAMHFARSICAEFDTRSIGYIPAEHVYNAIGSLNTLQIHDVLFSGTDWGPRSANPAPYNYPLGNTGAGAANIINGKSYTSSVNGATITIITVPLTEYMTVMVTMQPGGGVFNVTVNGVASAAINTASVVTVYNVEFRIPLADNGKGECAVALTKADANITEINAVIGYKSDNITLTDLSKRVTVNNFSQSGRTLSSVSLSNIIRACNAPALIMSLGYNDWASLNTDTDDAAFATFKQRIDWLIQYCQVYRTLVVVQDFLWYASLATSRTRQELKRFADSVRGVYIPYPDQFFSDGGQPTSTPIQLNDPMYLWADPAHPGPLGNELIFSTLATAMGLAVRSKRQALEYYDWPWPIKITHADWANNTPNFVRSISTIQQQGKGYRIKLNLDYTAAATAAPALYTISTGVSPKYRGGASPGLMFESQQIGSTANDVFFTQGDFEVGASIVGALVAGIVKTRVVEGIT